MLLGTCPWNETPKSFGGPGNFLLLANPVLRQCHEKLQSFTWLWLCLKSTNGFSKKTTCSLCPQECFSRGCRATCEADLLVWLELCCADCFLFVLLHYLCPWPLDCLQYLRLPSGFNRKWVIFRHPMRHIGRDIISMKNTGLDLAIQSLWLWVVRVV